MWLAVSLHFFPALPFLYLSSRNPSNLAVVFLVFCNLLVSLYQIFSVNFSSINLTKCPAHFVRFLTILPTIHSLCPTLSLMYFIPILSTLSLPLSRSLSHPLSLPISPSLSLPLYPSLSFFLSPSLSLSLPFSLSISLSLYTSFSHYTVVLAYR